MNHFIIIEKDGIDKIQKKDKKIESIKVKNIAIVGEGYVFRNPKIDDKMLSTTIVVIKYNDKDNKGTMYNSMEEIRNDYPDNLIQFLSK
jgi:hypothetical protein